MKEYHVLVGNRTYEITSKKDYAEERAKFLSECFTDVDCMVTHKNLNRVKGTPIYKNGEEVNG